MRKYLLSVLLLYGLTNVLGQIDIATSSAEISGFWNKGDSRVYTISNEKYTVTDDDTSSYEFINYKVDIKIVDSSPDSYTIEWSYRNYLMITDNPLLKKLAYLLEGRKVIIKTDKKGSFIEVVNWNDFKELVSKTTSMLKTDFPDLEEKKEIIKLVKGAYGSKEAIEKAAIKEIKQFYIFHGGKYKLDEQIVGQTTVPNYSGNNPFDAKYTLSLDEIDLMGFNSVIRLKQEVDSKQLTDVLYARLSNVCDKSGATMPLRQDFPPVTGTIRYASRIHNEGWVVSSIRTEETFWKNQFSFSRRTIAIH
jgi:hypothetical protein